MFWVVVVSLLASAVCVISFQSCPRCVLSEAGSEQGENDGPAVGSEDTDEALYLSRLCISAVSLGLARTAVPDTDAGLHRGRQRF